MLVLGLLVNWVAGALLALTIAFYVFVYTMWLKRRTAQNIVIGGAAGAFPPMIGWAAVTGSVSLESIALFLIIFMWTPPHFWALALYRSDDYARVGVPMLPVVAGPDETRRQIWIYSLLLVPVTLAPWVLGTAGRCLSGDGARCGRRVPARCLAGLSACAKATPRRDRRASCSAFRSLICSSCSPSSGRACDRAPDRRSVRERQAEDEMRPKLEPVVLTEGERRRQKRRSIAIAIMLVALVVMFYLVTIVRMGGKWQSARFR